MSACAINIAVEGNPDEVVLRKLLEFTGRNFQIAACYGKKGKEYLRLNISKFRSASRIIPYFVLADLDDRIECAPILVNDWLPERSPNLILRVAVREMEAWLLADRERFSGFLSVPINRIPLSPEGIINPKELIVALARRSKRREIREDIVPATGSTSKVGKNYNGKLIEFILNHWDIESARRVSYSLESAINSIIRFKQ